MKGLTDLGKALLNLDEGKVHTLVKQKIEVREDPLKIIEECQRAMVEVGNLFEKNEYFLSELIMSGEIFKSITNQLQPFLGNVQPTGSKGKVVIGTVKGDIHDIGKNIVATLLRANGFEVVDLGINVPAEVFVETVRKHEAKVLGLSALLNITFTEMKNVVDQLKVAGLRDRVKVVIGGAPCDEQVRKYTGADYYAKDAVEGIRISNEIYAS